MCYIVDRKGRENVKHARGSNSARCVSKAKAINRYFVRNIVDNAFQRRITGTSVYDSYELPKLDLKIHYCISCAINSYW